MPPDTSSPNGTTTPERDSVDSILQTTLEPLIPQRDKIAAQRNALREKANGLDGELKKIDRILRQAGLIEPPTLGRPPTRVESDSPTRADAFAPRSGTPRKQIQRENIERVRAAIEKKGGAEFQIPGLSREVGLNGKTVARAIGYLRGANAVVLVGERPPLERKTPGGVPLATFKGRV